MVRLVNVSLVVVTAAFVASTLPGARSSRGFSGALDGWLQVSGYALAAVLAVLRAVQPLRHRLLWSLVAGALVARTLGFLLYVTLVRTHDPVPYPSVADAAWVVSICLLIGAQVVAVRRRGTGISARLVLDGAVVALAIAALTIAFLFETMVTLSGPGRPASVIAINLAYPLLDVVLLVVGGGLLLSYNWTAPRSLWALVLGAAGISAVDGVFLYQVAAGTFRPGTLLPAISLLATAAIGWSGWLVTPDEEGRAEREIPRLIVPGALAMACLALLIYGTRRQIPFGAVVAAAAAIAVALARTGLSFQALRSIAEHQRRTIDAERRFRAVVEASPDAILGVDGSGRIVLNNDRSLVLLGVDGHQLTGERLDDFVQPPLSSACRELLDREPGAAVPFEWTSRHAETTQRAAGGVPLEIRLAAVVDASGERIVLVTARDISDRIAYETERRRRAQEAQEALHTRLADQSQLAAGIVHDFNNVLAVILSYTELARRRTLLHEAQRDIDVIRAAAEQGVALTDQLLEFARQQPAMLEPIEVHDMARDVLSMVEPILTGGIDLRVENPSSDVVVVADRNQIESVLLNLVLNARDAMPEGGMLTVRAGYQEDAVAITVTDTGHGMSSEVRERALEPFFTTKVRGNGSGLGLARAHGIVVSHGGTLEITSEPGVGTAITMTLPRDRPER